MDDVTVLRALSKQSGPVTALDVWKETICPARGIDPLQKHHPGYRKYVNRLKSLHERGLIEKVDGPREYYKSVFLVTEAGWNLLSGDGDMSSIVDAMMGKRQTQSPRAAVWAEIKRRIETGEADFAILKKKGKLT